MTKTFAQLQRDIAELEAKARAVRSREVQAVIADLRKTIDRYGLTAADLFGATTAGRKTAHRTVAGKASAAKGKTIAPKYGDADGNTWTGRGNRPRWLVAALADGSKSIDDFAV